MSRQDDIKKLIAAHSRRLQILQEQNARYGIDTPVHILIEIEDVENTLKNLKQDLDSITQFQASIPQSDQVESKAQSSDREDNIKRLLRNNLTRLQKLQEQQAKFGFDVDPRILTEIEDIEAKIADLQTELQDLQAQSIIDSRQGQVQEVVNKEAIVKLKNPYTFGVPVRGENRFFGREKELQLIFDTLENVPWGQKQDMVLMGPRRIGKSSILLRLLDFPPDNFIPLYVDLQEIKPREPYVLFVTILRQINKAFKQHNLINHLSSFETLSPDPIPEKLQYLTFGDDIGQLDEIIAQKQLPRPILMFDEIELLTEIGGVSALEWFRSLIQRLNYCIFIVAGSDLLYELTTDYTSPFFNIFKTVEVRALTETAATALITTPADGIGLSYPPSEIQRILHLTGRNPYFIQAMGHYLVERLNQTGRHTIQPADVEKVASQIIENISSQFNYFWSSFKTREQGLLYLLARQQRPLTGSTLTAEFLNLTNIRLSKQEQRGLLANLSRQQAIESVTEGDDPKYSFIVQLFANWINAKIKQAEITDRIRQLEVIGPVTDSDKDYVKNLKRTLSVYRRNLQRLEEQAAIYGLGAAPLQLSNQIEATKLNMVEIEEQLKRLEQVGVS